jgi:hypothetical protein
MAFVTADTFASSAAGAISSRIPGGWTKANPW